jgi:TonB family protein
MSDLFRRNFWVSASIHAGIVLVMVVIPLILSWRVRRKPHEIITYIDIQAAEPAPPSPMPEVKPPEPPKDIPEPPKRKKIEKSKKRIKREDKPEKKQMSPDEIKKLLDMGQKKPSRAVASMDSLPAWYYALVRQTFYDAWDQPGSLSASAGLMTRVNIRVERGGGVSRRQMVGSSGNRLMDDSVMKAVNSVSRLRPLPSQFPDSYKDITIDFELTKEF